MQLDFFGELMDTFHAAREADLSSLETGDEVMDCLQEVASREKLSAAQIAAIGAFSDATLFDWAKKEYLDIPVNEQAEVASLIGGVATDESRAPVLHIHLVLGKQWRGGCRSS